MSDGILTAADEAALGTKLAELEVELAASLVASREAAKPVDLDQPIGRVSRIDAIAQREMIQASRNALELRLRQVRAAQHRLEEGDYGDCQACGEEIGKARLEARPEALFCVACQSRRESSAS